jgi:hypothetical protein
MVSSGNILRPEPVTANQTVSLRNILHPEPITHIPEGRRGLTSRGMTIVVVALEGGV